MRKLIFSVLIFGLSGCAGMSKPPFYELTHRVDSDRFAPDYWLKNSGPQMNYLENVGFSEDPHFDRRPPIDPDFEIIVIDCSTASGQPC